MRVLYSETVLIKEISYLLCNKYLQKGPGLRWYLLFTFCHCVQHMDIKCLMKEGFILAHCFQRFRSLFATLCDKRENHNGDSMWKRLFFIYGQQKAEKGRLTKNLNEI